MINCWFDGASLETEVGIGNGKCMWFDSWLVGIFWHKGVTRSNSQYHISWESRKKDFFLNKDFLRDCRMKLESMSH